MQAIVKPKRYTESSIIKTMSYTVTIVSYVIYKIKATTS